MTRLILSIAAFFVMCMGAWSVRTASTPGWLLMAFAIAGLLVIFRMPRASALESVLHGLRRSLADGEHCRAEKLLVQARREVGQGTSQMHLQLDLAEGTLRFREGRYHEALMSLERCFLNSFAINDSKYGGESGLLLLKTLVALGRYEDTREFALGVRELTDSPEIEHLVAIAENRILSAH